MFGWITESTGVLRTAGAFLSAVGGIVYVIPIPQVQIWAPVLLAVGSTLGGIGVVRAAARGTLKDMKSDMKSDGDE